MKDNSSRGKRPRNITDSLPESVSSGSSSVNDPLILPKPPAEKTKDSNLPVSPRVKASGPGYIHFQPFEKHQTFWFPDGSLCVQLEGVRFKLHQSRLARASHFFTELFKIRESKWELEHDSISLKSGDETQVSVKFEEVDGFDLYMLNDVGVSLPDFEVLINVLESGVEFCGNTVALKTLGAAMRAGSTLRCHFVISWAVAGIERQWTQPTFLKPIPDAEESFLLARRYNLKQDIINRTMYELLRSKEIQNVEHLSIPQKRFDAARGILDATWRSVLASVDDSFSPCPLLPSSSGITEVCTSAEPPFYIPHEHRDLIYEALKVHSEDPIGALEVLISTEDLWKAAGVCWGCFHLRKHLWVIKREEMVQEMSSWLLTDFGKFDND